MKVPEYHRPGETKPARYEYDYILEQPTGLYKVTWIQPVTYRVYELDIAANNPADAAWRAARASFDCVMPMDLQLLGVQTLRGPDQKPVVHNHDPGHICYQDPCPYHKPHNQTHGDKLSDEPPDAQVVSDEPSLAEQIAAEVDPHPERDKPARHGGGVHRPIYDPDAPHGNPHST